MDDDKEVEAEGIKEEGRAGGVFSTFFSSSIDTTNWCCFLEANLRWFVTVDADDDAASDESETKMKVIKTTRKMAPTKKKQDEGSGVLLLPRHVSSSLAWEH